jgi:hypothetical protein
VGVLGSSKKITPAFGMVVVKDGYWKVDKWAESIKGLPFQCLQELELSTPTFSTSALDGMV